MSRTAIPITDHGTLVSICDVTLNRNENGFYYAVISSSASQHCVSAESTQENRLNKLLMSLYAVDEKNGSCSVNLNNKKEGSFGNYTTNCIITRSNSSILAEEWLHKSYH